MTFDLIKNIDESTKWVNKVYLTFDIDWASDEILSHTLDLIEKYDVSATFFCTHATKLLERMRENSKIELGIHPNFNFLVNGDFRYGKNMNEIFEYYLKIIPDAVSVRSHDLTQKTEYLSLFKRHGLKYDCNLYLPYNSGIVNKPFKHFDHHTIRVPHYWEDDVHCLYNDEWSIDKYLAYKGIRVFDFHPIHIALNSENIDRYVSIRDMQQNMEKVFANKFDGYGSESFLIDLIERVKNDM